MSQGYVCILLRAWEFYFQESGWHRDLNFKSSLVKVFKAFTRGGFFYAHVSKGAKRND